MTVARRLLLWMALMFWQGGFLFYAAVVVPVGSEVLGSHEQQGWITRSVTNYLNAAGAAALALWAWDLAAGRAAPSRGRRLRWLGWGLFAVTLGLQAWLHLRLDELLDFESLLIRDRPHFHALHRWYLIVSTAQWADSVVLSAATLAAWRAADCARAATRG